MEDTMLKSLKNNKILSVRKRGISPVEYIKEKAVAYQPASSLDTTLFQNTNRPKLKRVKRKIINDRDISPSLFEKLKNKCVKECKELKQKDIIEVLYKLNLSNVTIAKIVNDLIDGANATQGSIASMIRFLKTSQTSQKMAQELDKLLNYDL